MSEKCNYSPTEKHKRDQFVKIILCDQPLNMKFSELLELDAKVSKVISSGMTNAQISAAICRYVNNMIGRLS